MKKQIAILLMGMMMISTLLGGCGSSEQQASEQAVSSAESQQESSQQAETQEERSAGEENKVGLGEPYVLSRVTFSSNGTVTEYGYDENGDKISETVSYPDKPDETLYREYTTQYQEDGSKIVSESQTMLQATGEPISSETFEYEYNPDGLLIRKPASATENIRMKFSMNTMITGTYYPRVKANRDLALPLWQKATSMTSLEI